MLPAVAEVAHEHYLAQQRTTRAAAEKAQALYMAGAGPLTDEQWRGRIGDLMDTVTVGQITNADRSTEYVDTMGRLQGFSLLAPIDPAKFCTDDKTLAQMLASAAWRTMLLQTLGAPAGQARLAGLKGLLRTVGDLVTDSGSVSTGVQMALAPQATGFYRKLQLPSCDRCAVLAGRWYQWDASFDRHPGCDCTAIPAAEANDDAFAPEFDAEEAMRNGQITGLSKADRQAVEDGADFNQVANAKRGGLRSEVIFGRKVQTTTEGTTRRGNYGRKFAGNDLAKVPGRRYRVAKMPRLTPSEIYRQADDRAHAIRLLKKYGYTL